MNRPLWLEKRLADYTSTIQKVSTVLSRFPDCETWRRTPKLLKLRRYVNAKRALRAMDRGQATITTFPTYLTIDPFSACNLRCPLCPTGNGTNTLTKGTLQLDVFKHIVDELGTYLYNIDLYNWGEPLLNKQVYEMVRYAHDRHIITSISTNFHFFDAAAAERMIDSGLDYLILSIDGATQETYQKYRVRGKLDWVLKNVRTLTDTRKRLGKNTPFISWQYLVFRHNEHEIEAARELALGLGVDEFKTEHAYLPVATRIEGEAWIPRNPEYTRYNLEEMDAVWTVKEAKRAANRAKRRAAREEAERLQRLAEQQPHALAANGPVESEHGPTAATVTAVAEAVGATNELEGRMNPLPACAPAPVVALTGTPQASAAPACAPETIVTPSPTPAPAKPRLRLENCSWLYITTTVNADGKVYPCCVTYERDAFVGEVSSHGSHVTAFWNNEQYQAARLFSTRGVETGVETICHRCPIGGPIGGHSSRTRD